MPWFVKIEDPSPEVLQELQDLCLTTFIDTYAHLNDPGNLEEYLEESFNMNRLRYDIAHPYMHFFVLKNDEGSLGYIKLNELDGQTDLKEQNFLEVERIYVKKGFQRLGYGRMLIQKALDEAIGRRKKKIWLGVWEKNTKAIVFYRNMGFYQNGIHNFQLGNEAQNDLIMMKDLS